LFDAAWVKPGMVNLVELRNTALILRQWATEIRAEISSGPLAQGNEIDTLDEAAKLMEEAADEIDRNRRLAPK
jgi:hypothetical protein